MGAPFRVIGLNSPMAWRSSVEQARKLAGRLQVFRSGGSSLCHVNVIPLNPTRGYSGQATTRERARAFQAELERQGIACTIRTRRGIDIQAGCGQLAALGSNRQETFHESEGMATVDHLTAPVLRMRVSSRPSWCANMMGAGISSGVSFVA